MPKSSSSCYAHRIVHNYVEPAIDACKHYHSTASCVLYRGPLCLPLSSSCYAHRITHIYHLLRICSPSSSDILQPPWGGCSVVYFKHQSAFLLRCLHQPELLFLVQPPWGGGVPLFATTRVIVYRSVSLQLGRAAPLIIQHAVLFLATANYNQHRFLHC